MTTATIETREEDEECDIHDFDYVGSETVEGGLFINYVSCSRCGYSFTTEPTLENKFLSSLSRIDVEELGIREIDE